MMLVQATQVVTLHSFIPQYPAPITGRPMNQADPVVSRRTLDQVDRKYRERGGESERGRERERAQLRTT
jgi:hypothetical protein